MHFLPLLLFIAAAFARGRQADLKKGTLVALLPNGQENQVYLRANCTGGIIQPYIKLGETPEDRQRACSPTFEFRNRALYFEDGLAVIEASEWLVGRKDEGGILRLASSYRKFRSYRPDAYTEFDQNTGYLKFIEEQYWPLGLTDFCVYYTEAAASGELPTPGCLRGVRMLLKPWEEMKKMPPASRLPTQQRLMPPRTGCASG